MTTSLRTSNCSPSSTAPDSAPLRRSLRNTVQVKRMRRLTRMPTSPMTPLRWDLYSENSKLVRNPRLPSEKQSTGGTTRWNSHEVNRTVPSPPRVKTKSNLSGDVQPRSPPPTHPRDLAAARCLSPRSIPHRRRPVGLCPPQLWADFVRNPSPVIARSSKRPSPPIASRARPS